MTHTRRQRWPNISILIMPARTHMPWRLTLCSPLLSRPLILLGQQFPQRAIVCRTMGRKAVARFRSHALLETMSLGPTHLPRTPTIISQLDKGLWIQIGTPSPLSVIPISSLNCINHHLRAILSSWMWYPTHQPTWRRAITPWWQWVTIHSPCPATCE